MDSIGSIIYEGKDRRFIRRMVDNYFYLNEEDCRRDKNFLVFVEEHIYYTVDYCIGRVSVTGHVEDSMVEEMKNVAKYLEILYEGDNGRFSNEINKGLFKYLLECYCVNNIDKVAELYIESEILYVLSLLLSQYSNEIYKPELITKYTKRLSNELNAKLIHIMVCKICPNIKYINRIEIDNAVPKMIYYGVLTGYYKNNSEELYNRLKDLCSIEANVEVPIQNHNNPIRVVVDLVKNNLLRRDIFIDQICDDLEYQLIYTPERVNYINLPMEYFLYAKRKEIIENAKKYGGYDFYERVYNEVFLKDMRNMCMYPVREILTDDYFIRIHCENKKRT